MKVFFLHCIVFCLEPLIHCNLYTIVRDEFGMMRFYLVIIPYRHCAIFSECPQRILYGLNGRLQMLVVIVNSHLSNIESLFLKDNIVDGRVVYELQ